MLGALLFGLGLGLDLLGRLKSGKAQNRAAEAQAQIEDFNASVADAQAADAIVRGAVQAGQQRQYTKQVIGGERASFAGQGVDVNYGSAAEVQTDAAGLGALDELMIRANAQREAWGYTQSAHAARLSAEAARKGGAYASSAAKWGAATTILGGAGSLLANRYGAPGARKKAGITYGGPGVGYNPQGSIVGGY